MPDDTQVPPDAAVAEERAVPEQPDEATPAAPEDPEKLKARVGLLEAQLEESFKRARDTGERLKDTHERLLRSAAEFENFKKRATKEKEDASKFGTERLLKDFLPVMDNLERALDHAEQHDLKQVIEGVRLVQKLFESTLAKHGVVGFSAVGQPFDPTFHEALMQQESDEPPNTVVSEMARGYKLHDRLVRPAAVVVAKARTSPPPEGTGTGDPQPSSS
ncbi:MAG: nucleotide exchange factor GrpE [Myxococcales bacterium]